MKYVVLTKNVIGAAKFLTIQFELNETEHHILTKNFPTYTYSQLQPSSWKKNFFGNYIQFLVTNYATPDVNPREVHQELLILKDLNLINDGLMKIVLEEYCTRYSKKNPHLDWVNYLHLFGAGFAKDNDDNKPRFI